MMSGTASNAVKKKKIKVNRRVDVETIEGYLKVLDDFDALDLSRIDLYENGQRIKLTRGFIKKYLPLYETNCQMIRWKPWSLEALSKAIKSDAKVCQMFFQAAKKS